MTGFEFQKPKTRDGVCGASTVKHWKFLFGQGAPERNICFLVDESQAEDLVRRLHRLFFQSRFDRYSWGVGAQLMCQAPD
jgi:hypothetical protein